MNKGNLIIFAKTLATLLLLATTTVTSNCAAKGNAIVDGEKN